MKIEKAIELLELEAKGSPDIAPDDLSSAQRLGLAAMKDIKAIRQSMDLDHFWILEGETQ